MPVRLLPREAPLSGVQAAAFLLCPHTVEKENGNKLSCVPSNMVIKLIVMALPSLPNYLLKP